MTIAELKALLEDVPDEMSVMIMRDSALGGFMFEPPCDADSGVIELPDMADPENVDKFVKIFCLMPHGLAEDEDDDSPIPELN